MVPGRKLLLQLEYAWIKTRIVKWIKNCRGQQKITEEELLGFMELICEVQGPICLFLLMTLKKKNSKKEHEQNRVIKIKDVCRYYREIIK